MKTILLTGANGFVGRHLSAFLKEKNYLVIETGNSSELDLSDTEKVLELPAADVIIHLAAKSFVPDSFKNPFDFYRNNFQTTLNVLEVARRNNSKIIFFSTYVYGVPRYLPIDELHPASPLNPYTQSKIIGEELCKAYARDFGLSVVIFRPFNIYGPGQSKSFLIPKIITQLNGEAIYLADPLPKRDFIFIDDVLEAVYSAVSNEEKIFQTFNLGSGSSIAVGELVELILGISKSKIKVVYSSQVRLGEINETVADISQAQKHLGWQPKTRLLDGLTKTILSISGNTQNVYRENRL